MQLASYLKNNRIILVLLMIFAVFLRLRFFILGRPFWLDEAQISLYVMQMTDFLAPINAPYGFILVQKLICLLLGATDDAFRLLPLLSGIASIFLIKKISDKLFNQFGQVFALGSFALCWFLIYYSAEAKQYNFDVLFTLLLIYRAVSINEKYLSDFLTTLVLVITASWFSHAANFVIISYLLFRISDKNTSLKKWLIFSGIFLSNLGILTYISFFALRNQQHMQKFWNVAFMPMPPWSNFGWFKEHFAAILTTSFPGSNLLIVTILLLIGISFLAYRNLNRLLLIITPIFFALAASAIKFYGFEGRLLLFTTPLIILVLASSFNYLDVFDKKYNKIAIFISIILIIYFLINSLLVSINRHNQFKNKANTTIKQINYLNEYLTTEDLVISGSYENKILQYYRKLSNMDALDPNLQKTLFRQDSLDKDFYTRLQNNEKMWLIYFPTLAQYHANDLELYESQLESVSRCLQKITPDIVSYKLKFSNSQMFKFYKLNPKKISRIRKCLNRKYPEIRTFIRGKSIVSLQRNNAHVNEQQAKQSLPNNTLKKSKLIKQKPKKKNAGKKQAVNRKPKNFRSFDIQVEPQQ